MPRYRRARHPFRDHPHLAAPFDRALAGALEQLAAVQRRRGLTSNQLADRARFSTRGTRELLAGHVDVKLSTLVRLTSVLNAHVQIRVIDD